MSFSDFQHGRMTLDQASLDDPNPTPGVMKLFRRGQNLDENQIQPYETLFEQRRRNDPALAVLLLGYYFCQSSGSTGSEYSPDLLNRYADLLEWFIENHSSSFLVWSATYREEPNFERLMNAWSRQCSTPGAPVAVLNNAAHFCSRGTGSGDDLAEVFWKRAKDLSPSAIWSYELACLYRKQIVYALSPERKKELVSKVLQEFVDMQSRPNDYLDEIPLVPTNYLSPSLWADAVKHFRELALEFDLPFPDGAEEYSEL